MSECKHLKTWIQTDNQGHTIKVCQDCRTIAILVANGPDDCEWEEIE